MIVAASAAHLLLPEASGSDHGSATLTATVTGTTEFGELLGQRAARRAQPAPEALSSPLLVSARPAAITDPTFAGMDTEDPRQSAQLSLAPLAIAFAEGELVGRTAEFSILARTIPDSGDVVTAAALRSGADAASADPVPPDKAPRRVPVTPIARELSGLPDRHGDPAPSRSASPVANGLTDRPAANSHPEEAVTVVTSRIAAKRPVTGGEKASPATAPRQSAMSLGVLDADFGAAPASAECVSGAETSTQSSEAANSRPADRRFEFVGKLVPISVTLSSGSHGLGVTARLAGADRETMVELERLAAEALAREGFGLSALTLNGQPCRAMPRS